MAREIRIEVPDEVYEQLQRRAAASHIPAEQYAEQLLTYDLTRARFDEAAAAFVADHAEGFAARFGAGSQGSTAA